MLKRGDNVQNALSWLRSVFSPENAKLDNASDNNVFSVNKNLLTGEFLTDNGFIEKPACMILGEDGIVYMNVYYKDNDKYVITIDDSSRRCMIATKNGIIARLNSTLDDLSKDNKLLLGNEQRYNDSVDACRVLGGKPIKEEIDLPDFSSYSNKLQKGIGVSFWDYNGIHLYNEDEKSTKGMLIATFGEDNVSLPGSEIIVKRDCLDNLKNDKNFQDIYETKSGGSSINYYVHKNNGLIIRKIRKDNVISYDAATNRTALSILSRKLDYLKSNNNGIETKIEEYNETIGLYEKLGGKKGKYEKISSEKKN